LISSSTTRMCSTAVSQITIFHPNPFSLRPEATIFFSDW
jgi:hypothetical protein